MSVDAVVEGVHFRRDTAPPRAIGRKALASAFSDIAATGAKPAEAYVVFGIPADLDERACLEVLEGLIEGAAAWSITLAGGDVTRSPALFLSVTATGTLEAVEDAVRRDGAGPGQLVAVTGELGGAAAGLLLLEREPLAAELDPSLADALRSRQLAPTPRLAAGRVLAGAGAAAMIDLSDGLASDAAHVARASGARLEIELERLPLAAGVAEVALAAAADATELAIAGGEDYELLVCLPPDALAAAERALAATGTPLSVVGSVTEGPAEVVLRDASGSRREARGYDHLRQGAAERAGSA